MVLQKTDINTRIHASLLDATKDAPWVYPEDMHLNTGNAAEDIAQGPARLMQLLALAKQRNESLLREFAAWNGTKHQHWDGIETPKLDQAPQTTTEWKETLEALEAARKALTTVEKGKKIDVTELQGQLDSKIQEARATEQSTRQAYLISRGNFDRIMDANKTQKLETAGAEAGAEAIDIDQVTRELHVELARNLALVNAAHMFSHLGTPDDRTFSRLRTSATKLELEITAEQLGSDLLTKGDDFRVDQAMIAAQRELAV